MQLEHRFSVPASVDTTWEAFNDLNRIGGCLPGATITSVDGDDFTGSVKVKLGPISLLYNGTGSYTTRDEATRTVVIDAKGKDKRGNGTASAVITARLVADGDGTSVEVDTDLSITGKPAQFGRGVIQDVSDKLLGQFVECIKGKLTEPGAEGAAGAGSAGEGVAGGGVAGGEAAGGPAGGADPAPSVAAPSKAGPGDVADQAKRDPLGNAPSGGATSKAAAGGADHPATDASLDIAPFDGAMSQGTAAGGPSGSGKSGISAGSDGVGGPAGTSPATAVSGPEPELDLFATVGPVLVKRYAAPVLGGLVLLLILRKLFGGKKSSDD